MTNDPTPDQDEQPAEFPHGTAVHLRDYNKGLIELAFTGISEDIALQIVAAARVVLPLNAYLESELIRRRYVRLPGRPEKVNKDAYITALYSAYVSLKPIRAQEGKKPSHPECARMAGIEGERPAKASAQRLSRANPPTNWTKLTEQWDQEGPQN
jgi:hypothetical protein